MADTIDDDLGSILGTKPKRQAAPSVPDPIQLDLDSILSKEAKLVPRRGPSADEWGPWLNTLDALLLGQGRGVMPTGKDKVLARTPQGLTPDQAKALKKYNESKEIVDRKHAWEEANPGMAAITSILGSLPTSFTAAGLVKRGLEAPLMATRAAPLVEFLAGRSGQGVAGLKGIINRSGSQAAGGLLTGAGNAALTSGISNRPIGEQVAEGAALGGVGGPVLGAVANRLGSHVSPAEAQIAKNMLDQGVALRPGQLPGAAPLTKLLDRMFSKDKKQTDDFVTALTKTMGSNTNKIDQQTIIEARKRIGDVLNNAASKAFIPNTDPAFGQALKDLVTRASIELPADDFKSKFVPIIQRLAKEMSSGGISGDVYKSMTQEGSALASATARTSPIRYYAVQTKRALDEALERANPQAAAEIKAARHQWHNSVILEDLYDEASGKVDPTKLQKIIEREYGSAAGASARATKTGQDADIGKLAQGGTLMGVPKESEPGFLKKAFAGSLPIAGGVGIADMMHGSSVLPQLLFSDPSKAAILGAGAAGGYGATHLLNAALNSRTVMDRLIANALNKQPSLLRNRLTPSPPINPMLPAAQQLYETLNRAGEERTTPEGYPYLQAK